MRKKVLAVSAVLFSVMLLTPVALANVYVPPGPCYSMDAWICPYLEVIDLQDFSSVGWIYSDGPMYDPVTQGYIPKIEKWEPMVPWLNKLDIKWSTEVMVLGFIPKVYVAPNEVPPPVELVITWNGIPYVVTLTLPCDRIVGYDYPPKFYPEIKVPYEFAWPQEAPYKDAYYNIWVGDAAHLLEHWGLSSLLPPEWFETFYGMYNGYWFWYIFHPNVGDWIGYDCQGETKFPPTYDITALFEYSTSQIWFNHVCFDVSLLEVHKTVGWATKPWPEGNIILDTVLIENVGKETATELDFTQTFPSDLKHGVIPDYASAKAMILNGRSTGWVPLKDFGTSWPYKFTGELSYLKRGEVMTIYMELKVFNLDNWKGTIVFDSMVSAKQIPPWKEPIGLHSIRISPLRIEEDLDGMMVPLWVGWELYFDPWEFIPKWKFGIVEKWFVKSPILREKLTHPPPKMTLDPVPVDLNGDGLINAEDVALVRQAIVGLLPYDYRMDVNANGKIDTQDLAAYKLSS